MEKKEAPNRFKNTEVTVQRQGTQIVLPSDPFNMTYDEAIIALTKRKEEEDTTVNAHETVDAFPFDGAYAFTKAMAEIYGWATAVPKKVETFFGVKMIPPVTVNLEVDYQKFEQIIWGTFSIPGVEGTLETGVTKSSDGRQVFCIQGETKKKYQAEVRRLAEKTREIIRRESVYKGKAIVISVDANGNADLRNPPKFLDLSRVNPSELTYSDDLEEQVRTNLFALIEHTDACRKNQIPLKRGVLLEGPFGTGKTLAAFVSAVKCKENGWTFIMVDKVSGLKDALAFARQYQPAVVFAEDIDREVAGGRSVKMDDILNTIDGIDSKGKEVITVLTSNEVTNINQAMLRPGRLDAVIHVSPPDEKAAIKLVRLYARGLLDDAEDLTTAGELLKGMIPAVIREVVERSKLYALARSNGADAKLNAAALENAAKGMKHHLDLLYKKTDDDVTAETRLGKALGEVIVGNGMYPKLDDIKSKVEWVQKRLQ